jgi:hypothetical protein
MRKIRLFAAPFLLALLVAAAPAEAAGVSGPDLAARLWSWLWAWSGSPLTFASGRADSGPLIDPDGRNGAAAATPSTDQGPAIDPDGRTFATGRADSGPLINPDGSNGATTTTPSTDKGPIIDLNGRNR